jgi:hypothetical protein
MLEICRVDESIQIESASGLRRHGPDESNFRYNRYIRNMPHKRQVVKSIVIFRRINLFGGNHHFGDLHELAIPVARRLLQA